MSRASTHQASEEIGFVMPRRGAMGMLTGGLAALGLHAWAPKAEAQKRKKKKKKKKPTCRQSCPAGSICAYRPFGPITCTSSFDTLCDVGGVGLCNSDQQCLGSEERPYCITKFENRDSGVVTTFEDCPGFRVGVCSDLAPPAP